MTRKPAHERGTVPGCLACSDPGQLPGWLAAERARAADLDAQSAAIRQDALRADAAVMAAVTTDAGWRAIMAAQRDQYRLHAEANAAAGNANDIRAHTARVEAAHPRAAADRGGEAR